MYIQYKAEVKGISRKQKLRILLKDSPLTYADLTFQETEKIENNVFITFPFSTTIKTLQDAEKITRPLLDNIINLIIFKFNVPVKTPHIHGYECEENNVIATDSITLHNLHQYELTDADCNWLNSEINSPSLISKLKLNVHFLQYKSILTIEDDVSRFLLLYGLLYEIKGKQHLVDEYIRRKKPNVQQKNTTIPNKNHLETCYTWWRNQAQHIQSTTDIKIVTENLVELVSSLQDLVFEAIKDKI